MSKAVENLRWKVQFKESLLKMNVPEILNWIDIYFIDIKAGARDLRNVLHNALEDLLNSPYTKLPDDKNELFKDILNEYNSKGSLDSFKIYEPPLVGDEFLN